MHGESNKKKQLHHISLKSCLVFSLIAATSIKKSVRQDIFQTPKEWENVAKLFPPCGLAPLCTVSGHVAHASVPCVFLIYPVPHIPLSCTVTAHSDIYFVAVTSNSYSMMNAPTSFWGFVFHWAAQSPCRPMNQTAIAVLDRKWCLFLGNWAHCEKSSSRFCCLVGRESEEM